MDLVIELQDKINALNKSIKELRKSGSERALAEKEYKIILNKECTKLRNEGMAIGMIDKICYGIPIVADARFKRDMADTKYKANMEAINVFKLEIKIIQNQINQEYGNEKELY